ncbi:MAG: putative aspartyl protease [Alteromonadaceae bacterium]|jgi:predicted aspartyl protease
MSVFFRSLTFILPILILSGCGVVNVLKLRNANNNIEPIWSSSDSQFKIPTDYIGEKVFVYGTVNGVDGFKFMIDTGASFTFLFDTPKVTALYLSEGYELNLAGWGDEKDSLGHQTSMKSLQFGALEVKNFQGAFLRMSKTPYFSRPDELIYDGVIGHDLLRHFVWTFDKKANQVSVSNKPHHAADGIEGLSFDTFMTKISVEGNIDFGNGHKIDHEFIIDTGSRHYFKLSSEYPEANNVKLPDAQVTAADFGLSGKAEHQRVTLPKIDLGDIQIKNIKTNIIKSDDEDDYWVIGNAALNQFITTIDYQTNKIYLKPYENQTFKSRYNLLGLEVRKLLSGDFLVRFVMPELPAIAAGFNVGDIITQVDNVSAKDISKEKWLSISAMPGEYEICRETLGCKRLQSQHIKAYSN